MKKTTSYLGEGCSPLPPGVKFVSDKRHNAFLRTVVEEDLTRQQIRAEAIQFSDQNPFFLAIKRTDEIGREVAKLKRLDFLEQKRRQCLRVNTVELRQLQCDIRKAELITWLKEKHDGQYRKEEWLKQKAEDYAFYKAECDKRDEEDDRRLAAKSRRNLEVNEFIVNRIAEKQKHLADQCMQKFQDRKKMLDYVSRQKSEEDAELNEIARSKKDKKAEWDVLLAERAIEKAKAKEAALAEQYEYLGWCEQLAEERLARMEKSKQDYDWRNERAYKIGLVTYEVHEKKRIKDEALNDLLVGEKKMREDLQAEAEKANKIVKARELMDQHVRETYLQYYQKKEPELREEATTLEELRRIWAEDNKKAELKQKDARKAVVENKQFVAQMIEENKQKRAALQRDAIEEARRIRQADLDSLKMIEVERLRLLKQAPKEVLLNMHPDALRATEHIVLGLPPKTRGRADMW